MDALDVAFAGVIVTGAVGVGAPFLNLLNGRADRRHERKLAQDERLFRGRSEVYVDLLTSAQEEMLRVERTFPILALSDGPEPPEPMSDEAVTALTARIAAFGSERVVRLSTRS